MKINNLMADQSSSAAAAAQPDDNELPSGPKIYMLKLIEFNKIAILEKYGYAAAIDRSDLEDVQLAEIQSCMTRLMRQRLLRDELRTQLEEYEFVGTLSEQKAIICSLVKMSKKIINILYKKCFNFTVVK